MTISIYIFGCVSYVYIYTHRLSLSFFLSIFYLPVYLSITPLPEGCFLAAFCDQEAAAIKEVSTGTMVGIGPASAKGFVRLLRGLSRVLWALQGFARGFHSTIGFHKLIWLHMSILGVYKGLHCRNHTSPVCHSRMPDTGFLSRNQS